MYVSRKAGAVLLTMLVVPLLPAGTALAQSAHEFTLTQLKPDIYLLQRPNPLRMPVEGNVVFIVNEADVVVIDGGGFPVSAENAIKHIRSVTNKPVSVLVNTHWHGDHNYGNQAYREQYPGVRIVSHENTWRYLASEKNAKDIADLPSQLESNLATLRDMKAKGDWNERRELLLSDLEFDRKEAARIRATPPDLTFTDSLVLRRGAREIHIRHLGRANTDGDAVVWLPRERIVMSGDIVVWPAPYGFGSFPREWIQTLDAILALDYEMLVPGHGDVQRDGTYLELLQRTLASLREQAAAAVAKGLDLEATRKAIDTSSFERDFTGDDALKKRLFDAFWMTPIVRQAWLEASGKEIRQDELQ